MKGGGFDRDETKVVVMEERKDGLIARVEVKEWAKWSILPTENHASDVISKHALGKT